MASPQPALRRPAAEAVLQRMADVGLGYLRLGQPLTTLSGGERQRLELATHMGADGSVYVLDEPTTGLHLADLAQLLGLLDLGPGAGHDGGKLVFEGTPADLVAARSTLTAKHLAAFVEGRQDALVSERPRSAPTISEM